MISRCLLTGYPDFTDSKFAGNHYSVDIIEKITYPVRQIELCFGSVQIFRIS
jgi:hypothetical protein